MKSYTMVKTVLGLALTVLMCGCATSSKGPSDQQLISKTMDAWKSALIAKNIDQIMAEYSDSFRDSEGRGKSDVQSFIKRAIDEGYLDGLTVNLDTAQTTVNGDEATVGPIGLSGTAGSMYLSLSLKKDNGAWLIVGSREA